MNPNILFLARMDQLDRLLSSHTEVDVIDIARILRQLLLDKNCLFQVVNIDKVDIIFEVYSLPPVEPGETFRMIQDGLDPQTAAFPRELKRLNLERFLKHPIIRVQGQFLTIKDVIKYAANAAGAVHYDPRPKAEHDLMHGLAHSGFIVAGYRIGVGQLKAIGRVVVRSLQSLRSEVAARARTESASHPG